MWRQKKQCLTDRRTDSLYYEQTDLTDRWTDHLYYEQTDILTDRRTK